MIQMDSKETNNTDDRHVDEQGNATVIDHLLIIDEETGEVLVNKRG
jgi:hypothetical protein